MVIRLASDDFEEEMRMLKAGVVEQAKKHGMSVCESEVWSLAGVMKVQVVCKLEQRRGRKPTYFCRWRLFNPKWFQAGNGPFRAISENGIRYHMRLALKA